MLTVVLIVGTLTSVFAQPVVKLRNLEEAPGANYRIQSNDSGKAIWIMNVSDEINVVLTPIGYVPASFGNTLNLNNVVVDPNGDIWIIDSAGDAVQIGSTTVFSGSWNDLDDIPAGFADGTDNVQDSDSDPTNEIQLSSQVELSSALAINGDVYTDVQSALQAIVNAGVGSGGGFSGSWNDLTNVPAGFADDTDDVDDADADPANEIQQVDTFTLNGTTLGISLSSDGAAQSEVDLSTLQDGTGTDDQTAAEVSVSPITNLTATDVQAALAEHQSDIDAFAGGGTDDQTAAEVPITDAGGYFVATDVEAALQEEAVNRIALDQLVGDLITLSGVPITSQDLGTFTGTTITDDNTVKGALQELETAVEAGGGGGSGIDYVMQSSAPDTTDLWIDATTYDSTGVFQVKDYYQGWKTVAWYDSVGKVFSPTPPIYIVVSGQSNSTPRNSGGTYTTPSPYTSIYDPVDDEWQPIELVTDAAWMNGTGNNWWPMQFGRWAAELDKRIVKIVYVGRGGREINNWINGLERTELNDRIDLSNIPKIDAFLWYQGESDYDRDVADYADDFWGVITLNKQWDAWELNTQIIVAQLNTEEPFNMQNGFLNTLSVDTLECTKVVHNTDTDRIDAQHISALGHEQLGERMYKAFSGRESFQPQPQRYVLNQDTLFDFLQHTSLVVPDADTIVTARNISIASGWSGNLKINDVDSSGVDFTFPVVAYTHEGQENISKIFGRFASPCFIENDTLFLTKVPNYYISQNTPFHPSELNLDHWFRTDTIGSVFATGAKVDSLVNFGSSEKALIPASGTAPDSVGNINGVNAITFTPTDWLEIDSTGGTSGVTFGIKDIYMVIETADPKGALLQGNNTVFYYIWDTTSVAGANALAADEIYINDVLLPDQTRETVGKALLEAEQPAIVQMRGVSSERLDEYFRIMDYANNLSGFGSSAKFGELIVAPALFSRPQELQITRYLANKWREGQESINQVFSDIGKQSLRNPFSNNNTLDGFVSDAYAAASDIRSIYSSTQDTLFIPIYAHPHDEGIVTGSADYRGWRVPAEIGDDPDAKIEAIQYSFDTPGSDTVTIQMTNGAINIAGATIPALGYVENAAVSQTLTTGEKWTPTIGTINGTGHEGLMVNLMIVR